MKMIVAIQGTKTFDDYQIFLRAMGTALRELPEDDKEFLIFSAGPVNIKNSLASSGSSRNAVPIARTARRR